jgi:DNA-binding CsgD family transcriptional regulator
MKKPVDELPTFSLTTAEWAGLLALLRLSPQQARVLGLILQGKRDKQIARAMRIGLPTVRTHIGRLFESTRTSDRTSMVIAIFGCVRALERLTPHQK